MNKFLFKANNDVLSFCDCEGEPAMSTGQLDCPWCGCGWLISCSKCRKAFTFGVIRETSRSLIDIGRAEAVMRGIEDVDEQDVEDWAEAMAEAFAPFAVGDIVVYLDGEYFSIDATNIEFDGYFAHHKLKVLPHKEALKNPKQLDQVLGDSSYWYDREIPDRE